MENVVKTTVLLQDMNDFAAMNEVYAGIFLSTIPGKSSFRSSKTSKRCKG